MTITTNVRNNNEILSVRIGGFGLEQFGFNRKSEWQTMVTEELGAMSIYACKLVTVICRAFKIGFPNQKHSDKFRLFASRMSDVIMMNGQVALVYYTKGGNDSKSVDLFRNYCKREHFGQLVKEMVKLLGTYPAGQGVNSPKRFTDNRDAKVEITKTSPDYLPYGENSPVGVGIDYPYNVNQAVTTAVINLMDCSILGDFCSRNPTDCYNEKRVEKLCSPFFPIISEKDYTQALNERDEAIEEEITKINKKYRKEHERLFSLELADRNAEKKKVSYRQQHESLNLQEHAEKKQIIIQNTNDCEHSILATYDDFRRDSLDSVYPGEWHVK